MDTVTFKNENLLEKSKELKSGLGAVAWATLEMLKRGGLPEQRLKEIQEDMNKHFAIPTSEECNTILRVLEKRLAEDRESDGVWYS